MTTKIIPESDESITRCDLCGIIINAEPHLMDEGSTEVCDGCYEAAVSDAEGDWNA